MQLQHIDHGFFHLTARQARELSIEKRLPRPGHEIKADPEKVKALELVYRERRAEGQLRPCASKAADAKSAWIKTTQLSWWNGATVEKGWVWALHLYWAP